MNNLVCPQTATIDSNESMIQTQMGMIYRAPVLYIGIYVRDIEQESLT